MTNLTANVEIQRDAPGEYWLIRNGETVGSIMKEYVPAHNSFEGGFQRRVKGHYIWEAELDGKSYECRDFTEAKKALGL